jgi:hypothetical protein
MVMKTFPKCQALQDFACFALRALACCSIGRTNAIESGGIEVLLAAINNHLGSAQVCGEACWALFNMVKGNEENTELLISFGGEAAISLVRSKWYTFRDVDSGVLRQLTTRMTAFQQDARMMEASTSTVASLQMKAQVVTEKDSISSQSTLGIYHDSSDGASPSPKVPAVPSTPRNDNQLKPEITPELVSEQPRNDRKCKPTEAREALVLESTGEGERNATKVAIRSSRSLRERKSHDARVMDASTSTVASLQMNAQVLTDRNSTANAAVSTSNTEKDESTANAEPEHQIQGIGTLIQVIFYSDNTTVDAVLHALRVDLMEDSRAVFVGGCFAVPIMWLVVKEMIRWISNE